MALTEETLKMRRLIDRYSPRAIIAIACVKLLQWVKKRNAGKRRLGMTDDGWRAASQVYMRTEQSKICLAAFRLDIWSDGVDSHPVSRDSAEEHVIERLSQILRGQPNMQWELRWSKFSARRKKKPYIDIVHAWFDDRGCLKDIRPYLDLLVEDTAQLIPALQTELNQAVIRIYNQTKDQDDKKRPLMLQKQLRKWLSDRISTSDPALGRAQRYINRVLSATFISFEQLPSGVSQVNHERFEAPDFIKAKHPGFGLLNIICRFNGSYDEADFWFQCSHIPVDGAPLQDVLQAMKACWGVRGRLLFPAVSSQKEIVPRLCSTKNGTKGVYHAKRFVDFRPLLEARKELNARYSKMIGNRAHFMSLIIWGLGHHQAFDGVKFSMPVELAVGREDDRTVGFVFVRPSIFFSRNSPEEGFIEFQKQFHQQITRTRAGKSESYELLNVFTAMSPRLCVYTLKLVPGLFSELMGTVCLSIVQESEVGIVPLGETHPDGFIGFANILIPTEDGGMAGGVGVKAPRRKVQEYLQAVQDVAQDFYRYF